MNKVTPKDFEEKQELLKEWRKLYLAAVFKELQPTKRVLQVGFGDGQASLEIIKYKPQKFTILEDEPKACDAIKEWTKGKKMEIEVFCGNQDDFLSQKQNYDTIFFYGNSLVDEIRLMHALFPEEVIETSVQVKEAVSEIESQFSQIQVEFSDEDIEDFYQQIGQFNLNDLPHFFKTLRTNGNISEEQFQTASEKYLTKTLPEKLAPLLSLILKGVESLDEGGKLSCYLGCGLSKYDDPSFFEHIITNPELDYQESLVNIPLEDKQVKAYIMTLMRLN